MLLFCTVMPFLVLLFVVYFLCVWGGSSCGLGYSFFFPFLWGEDRIVDELCK